MSTSLLRSQAGDVVTRIQLHAPSGCKATFLDFGATLLSFFARDKHGQYSEVTVNYDEMQAFEEDFQYFGATVGRTCNRVKEGRFELNGTSYQLPQNNGPNCLHGGERGWSHRIWSHEVHITSDFAAVTFTLRSPDGEQGYPSLVEAKATYTLRSDADGDSLTVCLEAQNLGDLATPINMTNHAYWNLDMSAGRVTEGHSLQLLCDHYLPIDDTAIPTGALADVADTPFDFRRVTALKDRVPSIDGAGMPGLDHCFVVTDRPWSRDWRQDAPEPHDAHAPPQGACQPIALVTAAGSGRCLSVVGTQPGVQVYTANWLPQEHDAGCKMQHGALCLETQHFPDAVNQFRGEDESGQSSTILRPGESYRQYSVFRFTVMNTTEG